MPTSPKRALTRQQTAHEIRVLTGLEAIRLRPGMYLGAGPDTIYNMLYEALDSSLNSALAGLCDDIEIVIQPDSSVTITDNGEGLPVEVDQRLGVSLLQDEMTQIWIPGRPRHYLYAVSGGTHGIGLKAVNALSEWLVAEVRRAGYLWRQTYERGVPTSDVAKVRPMTDSETTGTAITFFPDASIIPWRHPDYDFSYETLSNRCRQIAYLLPGTIVRLVDRRGSGPSHEMNFCFEGGLQTFVKRLNQDRSPLHAVISGSKTVQLEKNNVSQVVEVTFAFQYTDDTHTTEVAFVNTLELLDGGTPLTGLRSALTRTLNQWAGKAGHFNLGEVKLSGRDTRQGLTAIVSLKHPFPRFESVVKLKLINPEVSSLVASIISGVFAKHLEENPGEAQLIVDHLRLSSETG